MTQHITGPTIIRAHGNPPKDIEEFIGRVNSNTTDLSVARMKSPAGWSEPGQRAEFDEYSIVLSGTLCVEHEDGAVTKLGATQAMIVKAGEWVRYSSPDPGGAEYISVCLPAFSPKKTHRDK